MGSGGRVVCIATPFLLSLGALVTLVLIFLAGTMDKNSTVDDFYFLKIDLTNLSVADSSSSSSSLGTALETAKNSLGVQDYYTLYLRSSCSWDADANSTYTNCTAPKAFWYFDPVAEWSLNETGSAEVDELLSTSLRASLSTYRTASKALFVLYTAALAAVAASLLLGLFAVFSRWGSFFTTLFASVAAALSIGASGLATALFGILRTALNHNLRDDYGVVASLGSRWLALSWIGTAFAIAASFFWLLSVCFCSGRSSSSSGSYGNGRKGFATRAEKTPYTYERVGSPSFPIRDPHPQSFDGQNVPLYPQYPQYSSGTATTTHYPHQNHSGTAYEPFRPQQV
ncbi:hypothetical protein DV735_g884, partial [Chaetothyriales sp. CBS 134920]